VELEVSCCRDAISLRGEEAGRTPDEASIEKKMAVARIAVLLRFMVGGSPCYTAPQELMARFRLLMVEGLLGLPWSNESFD